MSDRAKLSVLDVFYDSDEDSILSIDDAPLPSPLITHVKRFKTIARKSCVPTITDARQSQGGLDASIVCTTGLLKLLEPSPPKPSFDSDALALALNYRPPAVAARQRSARVLGARRMMVLPPSPSSSRIIVSSPESSPYSSSSNVDLSSSPRDLHRRRQRIAQRTSPPESLRSLSSSPLRSLSSSPPLRQVVLLCSCEVSISHVVAFAEL
jgi:hypothetical protein